MYYYIENYLLWNALRYFRKLIFIFKLAVPLFEDSFLPLNYNSRFEQTFHEYRDIQRLFFIKIIKRFYSRHMFKAKYVIFIFKVTATLFKINFLSLCS